MPIAIILDFSSIRPLTMLNLALTALWAWGVMFPTAAAQAAPSYLAQAVARQPAESSLELDSPALVEQLVKRQGNTTSACQAYGVDYQDGGSYFVDQRSTGRFQAVTKFEGYV